LDGSGSVTCRCRPHAGTRADQPLLVTGLALQAGGPARYDVIASAADGYEQFSGD